MSRNYKRAIPLLVETNNGSRTCEIGGTVALKPFSFLDRQNQKVSASYSTLLDVVAPRTQLTRQYPHLAVMAYFLVKSRFR